MIKHFIVCIFRLTVQQISGRQRHSSQQTGSPQTRLSHSFSVSWLCPSLRCILEALKVVIWDNLRAYLVYSLYL